jgi:hypothetical protein
MSPGIYCPGICFSYITSTANLKSFIDVCEGYLRQFKGLRATKPLPGFIFRCITSPAVNYHYSLPFFPGRKYALKTGFCIVKAIQTANYGLNLVANLHSLFFSHKNQ